MSMHQVHVHYVHNATSDDQGHAQGHAQGHTQGYAQGHTQGHAQGHAQGQRAPAFDLVEMLGVNFR